MTTAFRTAYESLLRDYLPRPVRTQREYEQACRQIAKLMTAGPELPQAESELLEILSLLVAQYESTEHGERRQTRQVLPCVASRVYRRAGFATLSVGIGNGRASLAHLF